MTDRMRHREILWSSTWFKFDNILSFYLSILNYELYRYNTVGEQCVGLYQDKRFYVDEYEGQKELREEYFKYKKEQDMMIARLMGAPYEPSVLYTTATGNLLCCFKLLMYKETPNRYFINRWLRRN